MAKTRKCFCGSELDRREEYDARGIFLCFTCAECRDSKLSRYRPDVLTDPNYWADEQIEDDY